MTVITKSLAATLRSDVNAALAVIAKKHGVDFTLGTIRFNPESMRVTLTGNARGAAGLSPSVKADPKLVAFKKIGARILAGSVHAIPTENDKFRSPSLGTVTFSGYNSRAHAYPFIVNATNGKRYKLSTMSAMSLLNNPVVAV